MLAQIVTMISGIGPAPVFATPGLASANNGAGAGQTFRARVFDNGAGARAAGVDAPASARPVEPVEPVLGTSKSSKANDQDLSKEDARTVQELKRRDTEVRAHERAHATTGGDLAGSPSFDFTQGPDGKRYATGGEVAIDSGPVRGDPDATIRKMEIVTRAALAPANPSSQDMQVARQAQQARTQAQAERAAERLAESTGDGKETSSSPSLVPETAAENAPEAESRAAIQLEAQSAYGRPDPGGEDVAARIFAANARALFA